MLSSCLCMDTFYFASFLLFCRELVISHISMTTLFIVLLATIYMKLVIMSTHSSLHLLPLLFMNISLILLSVHLLCISCLCYLCVSILYYSLSISYAWYATSLIHEYSFVLFYVYFSDVWTKYIYCPKTYSCSLCLSSPCFHVYFCADTHMLYCTYSYAPSFKLISICYCRYAWMPTTMT